MVKVKVFDVPYSAKTFDRELNDWLSEHGELDIVDIKYSTFTTPQYAHFTACVIYREHSKEV